MTVNGQKDGGKRICVADAGRRGKRVSVLSLSQCSFQPESRMPDLRIPATFA